MTAPLLHVDALRAGYGQLAVLDRVSLEVLPGEIVSVVGANGAGKTTLARALIGTRLVAGLAGLGHFRVGAVIGGVDPVVDAEFEVGDAAFGVDGGEAFIEHLADFGFAVAQVSNAESVINLGGGNIVN